MKNNEYEKMISIEIPDELDLSINKGITTGKKIIKRRKYIKKSTIAVAAAFVIFIGGINVSPSFADSLKDVPILGTLVEKFQWNAEFVKGGKLINSSKASITLKKNGEKEQLILSFNSKDAALYNATLNHFPETVTISLPGTESIDIIGEVERKKDASSYIKSIYSLKQDKAKTTYLQIEFEDTADVSIEEYKDPGKIVINLKPGIFEGRYIYSVRTLSFTKEEDLYKIIENIEPSEYRILRDDKNGYFLELGQFNNEEDAYNLANTFDTDLIVEKRWSNNVPTSFSSKEEYMDAQMISEYYELLMNATNVQEILDYLDKHLEQASITVQDTLLKGLTGYIKTDLKMYDLDKLNIYYKRIGKDIYEELNK